MNYIEKKRKKLSLDIIWTTECLYILDVVKSLAILQTLSDKI